MATDNHIEPFVEKLDDAYNRALHVDSLIAVFKQVDPADIDQGHWEFAMDVLFKEADSVSTMLDELAASARNGGAS